MSSCVNLAAGIVLVSHSAELALGAAELAGQVSGGPIGSSRPPAPTTATWAPARLNSRPARNVPSAVTTAR
jgi:hypothetical protein